MKIKLDHINITAENLETSVAWYQKVLGFKKVQEGTSAQQYPWAVVSKCRILEENL